VEICCSSRFGPTFLFGHNSEFAKAEADYPYECAENYSITTALTSGGSARADGFGGCRGGVRRGEEMCQFLRGAHLTEDMTEGQESGVVHFLR
jgi:hypothetical protein